MVKTSYCAINLLKKNDTDFTCFEYNELEEIAKALNKYQGTICKIYQNKKVCINNNSNDKIDLTKFTKKYDLWNAIHKKLKTLCKKEHCWIELDFINNIKDADLRNKLRYFTFKPIGTKSESDWLNTFHINEILQQYEVNYTDFKFIGAVPADFHRISRPNYNSMINKYNKIGIVFNTDKHTEPGQHWTSCFIDNEKKTVEYFDSLGNLPNKYIREFINRFSKKREYTLKINNIPHQKNSALCGIYSCYFIIQRLKGKTFNEINANIITDKFIAKRRKDYFLPS
jgi:hypothetical protein